MGRPRDAFWWGLANKLPDGGLECNYCGKKFKGGVSRIKWHLSGKGGNIGPCERVPSDIKEKAQEELGGHTAVREGNVDKVLKSSSVKRVRYTSVGEDGVGVTVAERGETSNWANCSLDIAVPFQISSSVFNNCPSTTNGGGQDHVADVPPCIQEEAMMNRRYTSVGGDSNGVNVSETGEMSSFSLCGSPSSVVELVKFLMSRNVPVDVIKDSHFWSLLSSVDQPSLRSWLQVLDNSAIIENSLWNFGDEMDQYMLGVKASWKKTGCTLMLYDLSEGKGKFPALDSCNLVAGFYCPRGFIFVEVHLPTEIGYGCDYFSELENALNNHHLNLSLDDVVLILDHDSSYQQYKCPYQEYGPNDVSWDGCYRSSCSCCYHDRLMGKFTECYQHYVGALWQFIYEKTDWLRNLMNKADTIYQTMIKCPNFYGKLRIVKQEATPLACLESVLEQRDRLRWVLQTHESVALHWDYRGITSIINDEEFWSEAKDVIEAVTPLFRISDLMDTLIPTAAYWEEANSKACCVLETYRKRNPLKPGFIFQRGTSTMNILAEFFNPYTWLTVERAEWLYEDTEYIELLESLVTGEERRGIEAEMKLYSVKCSNPFANISSSECRENHPVKLWDKYGSNFPLLRQCATKILSQPVTCLGKQLEKCMSQLHGSNNYILRLNALMKEEFSKKGDEIYQPIDIDSIIKECMEKS